MILARFATLLLAGVVLTARPCFAADQIWSAVVIASNSSQPKDAPAPLRSVAERLKRVLGYNQFEILGSATTDIDGKPEHWLVPTKHFWLKARARRSNAKAARGGYLLNLQLYHEQRELVETEAMLAPDSPLFIRGPLHARGQLLIVLKVQP